MNEFYLSKDEIAVLAGLMGADVIYGIESELFTHFKESQRNHIKKIVDSMMERSLFSIGFDNKASINKELYEAMDTMIHAEAIFVVNDIYYYKKEKDIYCLKNEKYFYCLKKESEFPELSKEALEINESLSFKDLEFIEEAIDSFDEQSAYDYLENQGKNASFLMDIFNNRYEKMTIEYYEWKDNNLSIQEKIIVGLYKNQYFEIYKDLQTIYYKGGLDYTLKYKKRMFGR